MLAQNESGWERKVLDEKVLVTLQWSSRPYEYFIIQEVIINWFYIVDLKEYKDCLVGCLLWKWRNESEEVPA